MNAIARIQHNCIQLDRVIAQNRVRQALGGVNALSDLVRACVDEAVSAVDQESFDWAMDRAERHAEAMEGAVLALRAELRRSSK